LSGTSANPSRTIEVTAGNLRQNHLYVSRLYDFFPADIVGGPRRAGVGGQIEIVLDGLNETVATDIAAHAQTGKPRGFLRCRGAMRRFFAHHQVQPGAQLSLQKLSDRQYKLSVETSTPSESPTQFNE
jgi:hypothetical protein